MRRRLPRLLVAGTGSGCGKTTLSCALLGALLRRGLELRSFKCGPDYIDPMFHRAALSVPSRNLDLFLCGEEAVRELLGRHTPPGGMALIEGAMGLYDGVAWTDRASANHLSRLTHTPVVLAVNGRGKALSVAAQIEGYLRFAPNNIAGVVLCGVSEGSFGSYRRAIEQHTGTRALGFLPHLPDVSLPSRHLGLVSAGEIAGLQAKLDRLADAAEAHIDLEALRRIAFDAPAADWRPRQLRSAGPVRVGVARDEAFCFYYEDNLDILRELGAQPVFFSPLRDPAPPGGLHGLILPGGYPELHARRLADNKTMREQIRAAVRGGMPAIAECGGFLYLLEELTDAVGTAHSMAGVLPGRWHMADRPGRFGYQLLRAKRDNLLCAAGQSLPAHEFHYARADEIGADFAARKPESADEWAAVHATPTLYAGFPHLHFAGNEGAALRFVQACARYRDAGNHGRGMRG